MAKRKYTQAEWARIQARLPEEDQVPYSESPMVTTIEENQAALTTSAEVDPYYVPDPKTGLSPAQLEARGLVEEAASGAAAVGIEGKVVTPKGESGQFIEKPVAPPPDGQYRYEYQWVGASTGTNIGSYKLIRFPLVGGSSGSDSSTGSDSSGSGFTGSGSSGSGSNTSGLDANTAALIKSLQDQIAALTASNQQSAIDKAAEEAAAKKEKAENAITVLTDRFTKYGLASLVPKIKELAIGGASESTITLQLQETEEYRQRFRANQDRIKKGLRVLDPGDYLGLEDDYRQILRAYGLKAFDTDDYVQQFIANDISETELSNRVVTAVQRVQNADPAILATLRGYYGISDNDLVAYVLDPNQQFQKIERQVAAAEIGAAAGLQGLTAGVTVAEQLAAQGVTKAQAQKGYATIADILPTAEKLSDIYGGTLDEYRQSEAEQEVFNTLASAQRKRRALAEREIAAFGGASGLGKTALDQAARGTF
jgi:hypothetical protein